jgi:hypothetical protein
MSHELCSLFLAAKSHRLLECVSGFGRAERLWIVCAANDNDDNYASDDDNDQIARDLVSIVYDGVVADHSEFRWCCSWWQLLPVCCDKHFTYDLLT